MPDKANPPLLIDANTVLPFAIALQGFQLVAGWNLQAGQLRRGVQLQELASGHPFDVFKPGHHLAAKKRLGVKASEGADHVCILF